MAFTKITESNSHYNHLEKMEVKELLININKEDQTVAHSVSKAIPQIELVTERVIAKLKEGGRLFYLGAGTSGRMGILDASECPPTFGVSHDLVIGLIAGGDSAIRKAVEFAEDSELEGWKDLREYDISSKDFVIGIAASGTTPYVVGALKMCNDNQIETACITCNPGSPVALTAQYPIEVTVGPEFVTGSTRMKAGTAQKMVLNMISTAAMIHLGRIKGNKMVDMQLSNNKLIERGVKMIMEELDLSERESQQLLNQHKSVRNVLKLYSIQINNPGTDIQLLKKGISNLIIALPLMFLGPYLITLGFLNKDNFMLYVFLILGIGAAVTGVYFAYRGINVIIESMFGKKKK